MSFDSWLFDDLQGIAPVYPQVLRLGTALPAITYQRISTRRVVSHDGTSLVEPLYQIGCWSNSVTEARQTAREVIEVYEAQIGQARVENTLETFLPEPKLYRVTVDVRLVAGLDEEVDAS